MCDATEAGYKINSASSNKLLNVIDAQNDTKTKLGDFRASENYMNAIGGKTTATQDYSYDANGNLTVDKNKDITAIVYNHLNLPWQVTVSGRGTIKYIYDATGNKLEKRTSESYPVTHDTKTTYIGGYVYQNDTLQFLGHEEGRARKNADGTYVYDYFIKDHLGNIRMVLTEEQQTDAYPAATMETANAAVENAVYSNIDSTRSALPAGYPSDATTTPNNYVAKVNGSGNKIGPGIVLRVMSGDQFSLRATSWYRTNGSTPGATASPVSSIVAALAGGISYASDGKATVQVLNNPGVTDISIDEIEERFLFIVFKLLYFIKTLECFFIKSFEYAFSYELV